MFVNILLLLSGAISATIVYWAALRTGVLAPPRRPRSLVRIGRSPVKKFMEEESRRIDRTPAGTSSHGSRVSTAQMARRGRAS